MEDARRLAPRVAIGRRILGALNVERAQDLAALGHFVTAEGMVSRQNQLAESFEGWFQQALSRLRTISQARKNLTPSGISHSLAKRLARSRQYKRLDTQIAHAVGELEATAEEDLVYNDEIPKLLDERRKQAVEERRRAKEAQLLDLSDALPGMETVRLGNREQLRAHFGKHPEVAQMVEGALDAYASSGADASRQALASSRSAIEQAIAEATGERSFRAGLVKVASGTRRKVIGNTYDFLSGFGSHAGGRPTKKDAAYGIRMAIAGCSWILEDDPS